MRETLRSGDVFVSYGQVYVVLCEPFGYRGGLAILLLLPEGKIVTGWPKVVASDVFL